eukprot:763340-Hanusia_phi.AAC.11
MCKLKVWCTGGLERFHGRCVTVNHVWGQAYVGFLLAPCLRLVLPHGHHDLSDCLQPGASALLVELHPDDAGEGAGDDLADAEHDGGETDDAHDEAVVVAPGPELEGVEPADGQALEGDGADGELEDGGGAEREEGVGVEEGGDEGGQPVAVEGELVLDQQEEGHEAPEHVEDDVAGGVDVRGGGLLAVDAKQSSTQATGRLEPRSCPGRPPARR